MGKSRDYYLTINADDIQDILNGSIKETVVHFLTTGKRSFPCGSVWLSKTKRGIVIRINGDAFEHPLLQRHQREQELKSIILYEKGAIRPQEEWK